jgi:hypothetical protein
LIVENFEGKKARGERSEIKIVCFVTLAFTEEPSFGVLVQAKKLP